MLNLREIEVFKPYDSEFPEALLSDAGFSDAALDRWRAAPILRIAKRDTEVLGIYAMQRVEPTLFHLFGLVVTQPVRKQGLGRWLVGHAIGVAESKGARVLTLAAIGSSRMFQRVGFVRNDDGWQFNLIQE